MKKLLLTIVLILPFVSLWAQGRQTYDSTYSIRPGVSGHATFQYKGSLDLMIKEGTFLFIRDDLKQDSGKAFYQKERWVGVYNKNLKAGKWKYETQDYNISLAGVKKGELQYEMFSESSVMEGAYAKGKQDEDWTYIRSVGGKDSILDEVENVSTTFDHGVINGPFIYKGIDNGDSVSIEGQAVNGLMHGIWTIRHDIREEIREYHFGILKSLSVSYQGDMVDRIDFPLSPKLQELINEENPKNMGSSGKLRFKDGYPSESDLVSAQSEGNNSIEKALSRLYQNDPKLLKSGVWGIGTYRAIYPFTDQEKEDLKGFDQAIGEFARLLKKIEDEEVLSLGKGIDTTITMVLNWLEHENDIMDEIKENLKPPIAMQLERMYRDGLITDSVRSRLAEATIVVGGETKKLKYSPEAEEEENLIAYFRKNFEGRLRIGDSLHTLFLVRVKSMHLDQALTLKQQKILGLINLMDSSVHSGLKDKQLDNLITEVHDHYLVHIVDEEYQDFLNEVDNKEHQAVMGDSILLELNSIEEIYVLVHFIAERRKEVDKWYTEYVFDPFTFTDSVPQRIKKRLYDLVAVQMFDQLVEKATKERDPFHCEETLRTLYEMQGALMVLRDRDTRKLEGKLKRHKALEDRIKYFNEELE